MRAGGINSLYTVGAAMTKLWTLCLLCVCFLAGCTLPRREADTALFATAAPVGFSSDVRYYSADWRSLEVRLTERLQRVRNASPDGTVNVLALSGGGAAGAFGAGALVGLSRRGERPEFQVVTGVSTGALIAPFAFLGPDWDAQLREAFSGARTEHLLHPHWLSTLFRPGVYDSRPLAALVDRYITLELLHAVDREASRGRLLEVATTDLDKEETVVWDMGAIAARGDETARQLFRDVLLASASVPGAFRPVLIHVKDANGAYDEMHVDGAATVSFVGAPESVFFSSLELAGLERGKIFVLVNGQLASAPSTTPFRTMPVLARSVAAATKHMTRMELASTAGFAHRHGMELQFSAVPPDYSKLSALDFRPATMKSLFDYGARCAEQGRLWTTVDQAIARADRAIARWQQTGPLAKDPQTPECPLDDPATVPVQPVQQTMQVHNR
ncbi:MAG: Patatin-like phospholipase [Gammaproteobacteria bacterium]|nr:Patatin-like phospholipase [Gammaproteobacteria bacterium]